MRLLILTVCPLAIVATLGCASDDAPTDAGPDAPRPSPGCDRTSPLYAPGTTEAELVHEGTRSFRVHVPPAYDGTPRPLVVMLHGGGGSGRQLEQASSGMNVIADREGFVVAYPDGTGLVRTWNAGGCCGKAAQDGVDDVGFVAALLDHLEDGLCIDTRRVFASGMSNGAMLSHRIGCELSSRIAAIAPVAGTDMTASCAPSRAVPVLHTHGSSDGHVPFAGGEGCGPAGVPFTSVPVTIDRWRTRNACSGAISTWLTEGDGTCETIAGCEDDAEVVLCTVAGGGHSWPGGAPNAGVVDCPSDGAQSTTFRASEAIWRFFAAHPMR